MRKNQLPEEYALVLQQINDDGGDTLEDLLQTVQTDRKRMKHIIGALQHKGLITIEYLGYDVWMDLSAKGRRFMQSIWPESAPAY